ncbi:ATP-grasp domain-containing protein, partial [Candidatus Pacearchaeota archaeon]|nr:ATP-grasp domain-containing protein [Candidatus Pacearchaeota archaeon]
QKILNKIPLDYCVNVQTKGGKLLEINPRVSTFVYQEDLILPYLAIKLLLNEITEDELRSYQSKVRIGWKSVRYYDQVFFS